jgi:hypothetical protein
MTIQFIKLTESPIVKQQAGPDRPVFGERPQGRHQSQHDRVERGQGDRRHLPLSRRGRRRVPGLDEPPLPTLEAAYLTSARVVEQPIDTGYEPTALRRIHPGRVLGPPAISADDPIIPTALRTRHVHPQMPLKPARGRDQLAQQLLEPSRLLGRHESTDLRVNRICRRFGSHRRRPARSSNQRLDHQLGGIPA